VRRCPAKQLMQLYKVAAFDGPDEFLQQVATVSKACRWVLCVFLWVGGWACGWVGRGVEGVWREDQ
jgi:hypothetical protein